MYLEQLNERNVFKYPPYHKLIKITLKHKDFEKLKTASFWLFQVLNQQLNLTVLGPEEPSVSRIRNEYIRVIIIKVPNNILIIGIKKTIQKILNSFFIISQFRAVKVTTTVDVY